MQRFDDFDQFDNNEFADHSDAYEQPDDQEYEQDLLEQRRQRRMEMKKKRIRQQRIILASLAAFLLLLIILISSCIACSDCSCSSCSQDENIEEPSDMPPIQPIIEEEVEQDITATLAAVGDIMMYDSQIKAGQIDDTTYDFSSAFKGVMAQTISPDITVGNLELNLLGYAPYVGDPQTQPFFNAPEVLATNLADIGFDVMLTANTYSIMNGINGMHSTINFLNQASIDNVGTHYTDPAQSGSGGVVLRDVGSADDPSKNIRIAFIGFTKGLNGMSLPTNNQHSVDLLYKDYSTTYETVDTERILERVEAAKDTGADIIVAMLHWGSEYDLNVSKTQEEIRDLMFKNGVDVILGSHSHVVGPMEMVDVKTVDGEKKQCFVAYSLGNFYSDMSKPYTQESVILNMEFTKDADTGDTVISDVSYVPIYILDRGEGAIKTRFEVLPIRKAIESSTVEEYEDVMTAAIESLKTNTNSDYDSGK